jgi:hypothetical protein
LLLAFAIGTHIAVALPGQWHLHYYQLWLPLLAVGAGWAAVSSFAPRLRRIPRWVPSAVASAAVILLLAQQVPLYRVPPEAWSRLKYGQEFIEEQQLGRELGALLAPGETFYEFGAETGLYFESRHAPPSGAFYLYPMLEGPAASALTARAITDLQRRSPTLFVVNKSQLLHGWVRHPIMDWAQTRYVALADGVDHGTYVLLVRRGSRLDVTPTR